LTDTGAKIDGTVHNEITLEVPDKTANGASVILKETMTRGGQAKPAPTAAVYFL
jgi:hypothetical protein